MPTSPPPSRKRSAMSIPNSCWSANGKLIEAGRARGLAVAQEFFTDRNYTDEGTLVPRSRADALIADEEFAVRRAVRAVKEGTIESASGKTIAIQADTICVHGDNAHALEFVSKIRSALESEGIEIKPVE